MEKKILFVAYLYPPVGGGGLAGSQRMIKFVRYLSDIKKYVLTLKTELYPEFFPMNNNLALPINHETIIRTGAIDVFKILLKGREFFNLRFKKNISHETNIASSNISDLTKITDNSDDKNLFKNIKSFISELLTIPDYAYAWIIPAIWHGRKIIIQKDIDIVIATGMPWSCLVIGWMLKVLTGVKLIVDFRDPWIGNLFFPDKNKLRRKIEEYLEQRIVTDADIVSLNTYELKHDLVARYNFLSKDKFIVLPNGYDEKDFKNIESQQHAGEDYNLLLTHTGTLYKVRSPKPVLEAIAKIQDKNPDIAKKIIFRQIGYTELDDDIKGVISAHSLEKNYDDIGLLPFNQCLQRMTDSDILVIIQQDTKTQIPSKIYEYIYLNKPVLTIAQKDGALGKMVAKYQFGEIFEPHDIDGLADYLIRKVSEKTKNGMLQANYEYREKFDVRNIAKRLEKIIEELDRKS